MRRSPFPWIASYSFVYFFIVALALAALPLYFKNLGFSPMELAIASSMINVGALVGPPLFLRALHNGVGPRKLLKGGAVASAILVVPLLTASTFVSVTATLLGWLIVVAGIQSLVDYYCIKDQELVPRFEHVRIWGSLGFITAAQIYGLSIDHSGVGIIPILAVAVAFVSSTIVFFISRFFPPGAESHAPEMRNEAFPWRMVAALMIAVILCWISHGTLYVYFTIHLTNLGWSGSATTAAWNFGVIAEVGAFLWFARLSAALSFQTIVRWSLLLATIRWVMLGVSESFLVILAAQILHAASFGTMLLGSLRLLHHLLPKPHRAMGQAVWSAASAGGILLGRTWAGVLATVAGGEEQIPLLFVLSAIVSLLGYFAALCLPNSKQSLLH